jgi:2-polyprenyl-3-methyl-5-hydroxy-6-metoxy-1,4-benzoquinol methylase
VTKPAGYYQADKRRMIPYVPADARLVLDVGCGAGRFGADLKAERPEIEVWGVEAEPSAATEARPHLDHLVEGHYPEVIGELDATFDCVVFNDVLEHLTDPWAALEATTAITGCAVASIPNVRNWRTIIDLVRHGQFRYEDAGVHDIGHLRFFTRRSAVEAFEATGWRVTVTEMVNPFGYRRARLFGALLAPVAHDLGDEADFKQIVIVATAG